eukprot:XP_001693438.1 predicted protein [Chlamydomonas reinhardtii]
MLTLTRRSRDLLAAGCWPRRCAAALLGPHEPPQQPTALLPPLPLSAEGARGLAGSAPGGPPDERLQRASRLIDGVVNRVVDRLSRGDFEPHLGPLTNASGHAGGAGEAGGGGGAMDTGRGAVTDWRGDGAHAGGGAAAGAWKTHFCSGST